MTARDKALHHYADNTIQAYESKWLKSPGASAGSCVADPFIRYRWMQTNVRILGHERLVGRGLRDLIMQSNHIPPAAFGSTGLHRNASNST